MKYRLEAEDASLPDTTVREKKNIRLYSAGLYSAESIEAGGTEVAGFRSNGKLGDLDAETLRSYQIREIEVTPLRAKLE